ncbi:RNA polymerase sigma-70 factor [Paraburkholderia saeva]|uniref:ECF RNA polymerase sigma factor SigJ n=1 Tax=Paraburkholderia saeva TaxID=2777537 RepID=A0A9N8X3N9_9BURK|nr:RNA polymerase sigma-70 factor [Paraburkholderia saeva]CAG4888979.1 ECF RNA polymerase sigma factor SigJ [Paraburkholderia saeva]CAG4894079.1 ECF RNA polymerase sigma factor SigJ [Paraburkholderia saeva]CAG4916780.1 ECF RNA polymerase sigma factor SigJ [Paraburkholderia saeva]
MNDATDTFNRLRRRLHGIAYRMLGSSAEAEEVVQDAWIRWHETGQDRVDNAEAWLVSVTTRLAIDRLRTAKVQREHYVGTWLPEPLLEESPGSPEEILEHADNVSVAFLTLLERLAPEARAAYLLREVFDAGYDEVAEVLGKSEAACRQIVHRAKAQVRDERPRHTVTRETQLRLLRGFADAAVRGEFAALKAMLADDAQLVGDGGGKVPSFGVPMVGGQRIAQLYFATRLRYPNAVRYEVAMLNGQWGLLRFIDGTLESAQTLETDGERIVQIHAQRNPDKLARIAAALGYDLKAAQAANAPPVADIKGVRPRTP